MKRNITKKRAIALALASIPMLAGCGASSPTVVGGINNPLPGNYVPTLGGCVPINQAVSFTGTGVSLSGSQIMAGRIPNNGQAYGTTTVGYGGTYTGTSFTYNRSGVDGTIGFNATQVNGTAYVPTYPYSGSAGSANITGVLQISSAAQQMIMSSMGNVAYNGTNTPCVSGIAIQSYLETVTPSRLYNGYVYLYMNNSQNGYVLYF